AYLFGWRAAAPDCGVASPPEGDTMVEWTARPSLAAEPGAVHHYNNTSYALRSRVIERATGRAWIDLVSEMSASAGVTSWRLGQSLALPSDEARYYEAQQWRYARSVFDSAPGTVEWPYGGYNI